jgi:putative ABC transport system permease protein
MMGGVRMDMSTMRSLTLDDYNSLKNDCKLINNVSPQVNGNGRVIYGANNWPTSIMGVSPEYLNVRVISVVKGSMFNEEDIKKASKVVVIGQTIVENLFKNGEEPVGKIIRFNNIPFMVIGVLSEKGENTWGQDQDDVVLAPYTSVQKRILSITHLQSIVASAITEDKAPQAVIEIQEILRKNHKIMPGGTDDFNVFSQQEFISTFTSTSQMLTVLLVAIASISLFIGGIGIMNIMYVSVKERTREIGLRMAVGGRGRDIMFQFLVEAVLISITGGIIGVGLGLGFTLGIKSILNWPICITLYSMIISFAVCVVTGVCFWLVPARKGAALDPINALRYE